MTFNDRDEIDPRAIVMMARQKKAEGEATRIASIKGKELNLHPWARAGHAQTRVAWVNLHRVYEWSLTDRDPHGARAYARAAEYVDRLGACYSGAWKNVVAWVHAHGDPRLNKEWSQWHSQYAMERS